MFQGLSTALTSLYANQQALETTGNNIANVNTEGYSRQQVILEPNGGVSNGTFWSSPSKVGTGVSVKDIQRVRDEFLASRSLTEHGTNGNLTRMKSSMDTVELTFKEPSDTGLQEQLAEFWGTWDDVANNPGDLSARSQVIEQAQTLTTGIQQAASDLQELKDSSLTALKNDTKQLNAWAKNIADLNQAIQSAFQAGSTPNALMDQRDLLVSKMSDMAGATVQNTQNGSVAVLIGGVAIVRDHTVRPLQVDDSTDPPQMRWDSDGDANTTTDGSKALVTGGDMQGLLSTISTIVPKYKAMLDSFANNLISTVNTQHTAGLDKAGNPGGAFFTGTSASTIAVDTTLAADPTLLAASKAGGGTLDGENARAMANLANASTGPDTEYRTLVNTLGVESSRATNQAAIQKNIVSTIDAAKDSVSGVSLDEEMTNMIRFQKAYSASAKYLTVMDDVLNSLIGLIR